MRCFTAKPSSFVIKLSDSDSTSSSIDTKIIDLVLRMSLILCISRVIRTVSRMVTTTFYFAKLQRLHEHRKNLIRKQLSFLRKP